MTNHKEEKYLKMNAWKFTVLKLVKSKGLRYLQETEIGDVVRKVQNHVSVNSNFICTIQHV